MQKMHQIQTCQYASLSDRDNFCNIMATVPVELPPPSETKGIWLFHQYETICNPTEENDCAGTCGLVIPSFFAQVESAIKNQDWQRVRNLKTDWEERIQKDKMYETRLKTI